MLLSRVQLANEYQYGGLLWQLDIDSKLHSNGKLPIESQYGSLL
jgi:hypothetical protein